MNTRKRPQARCHPERHTLQKDFVSPVTTDSTRSRIVRLGTQGRGLGAKLIRIGFAQQVGNIITVLRRRSSRRSMRLKTEYVRSAEQRRPKTWTTIMSVVTFAVSSAEIAIADLVCSEKAPCLFEGLLSIYISIMTGRCRLSPTPVAVSTDFLKELHVRDHHH